MTLWPEGCTAVKEWTPEAEEGWRADLVKTYGDGADEELFCIPRQSSGAYLTAAMIEACMQPVPVLTWMPPADNFVDWPLPVAETYTKGWITEHFSPLLAALCTGTEKLPAQDAAADSLCHTGQPAAFLRHFPGRQRQRLGPGRSRPAGIRPGAGAGGHDFRRLVQGNHAAAQGRD